MISGLRVEEVDLRHRNVVRPVNFIFVDLVM